MTIPTLSRSSVRPNGSFSPDREGVSSSPLHTLARVTLILTLCGAPWAFGAVQPWAWGTMMVLSLLTLVLWAAGCAQRGVLKISWSPLYWPFLGFLILALVQLYAGLSLEPIATREAVLKIVTNLVLFFVAGQLLGARTENGTVLEEFGLVVTLLATALCLLALAQAFGSEPGRIYWTFSSSSTPFGPYVNHNDYAGLMEMLIPISAAYLLSRSWNPLFLLWFWCAVVMALVSVWISGSRGATAVLLIEGLLFAGILMWNRSRAVSPSLLAVLLGVVLVSAVVFSWLVSTGRVAGRAWSVFETNRSLEVNLGDRYRVGIDTLHMARSHPWAGIGVGCFESVFPGYLSFPMDLRWSHAHDDLVEAAAETGLPGVVLMLVALALFCRVAFHQVTRRLRHGWGWVQMGATVGAVGLLFHSLVDFNLRIPANAACFVVCLAMATHPGPPQKIRRKMVPDPNAHRSNEFLT